MVSFLTAFPAANLQHDRGRSAPLNRAARYQYRVPVGERIGGVAAHVVADVIGVLAGQGQGGAAMCDRTLMPGHLSDRRAVLDSSAERAPNRNAPASLAAS